MLAVLALAAAAAAAATSTEATGAQPIAACCNRCTGLGGVGSLAEGESPLLNHSTHRLNACVAGCKAARGGAAAAACTASAFVSGELDAAHCPLGRLDSRVAELLGIPNGRPAQCAEQYLRDASMNDGLLRVGARLRAGLPTTVSVVGGSVSQGTGASPASTNSFPRVLERVLRSYFPHTPITVNVFAYSGTGTRYWAACPDALVSNQTHLVVLDVSVNDYTGSMQTRESMLLGFVSQLLARMPGEAGAAINMNWRSSGWKGLKENKGRWIDWRAVAKGLENSRNSVKVMPQVGGVSLDVPKMFGHLQIGADAMLARYYASDGRHPNNNGHELIGTALANLVRDAVVPPPHARHQRVDVSAVLVSDHALCTRAEGLHAFITDWGGWELVDEAKGEEHRWGLVSLKSKQVLTLTLTSADGSGGSAALAKWTSGLARDASIVANQESPFIWAELDFLKSYGDWGGFDVSCPSACTCLDKGKLGAGWLNNEKTNPNFAGLFPHINTKHDAHVSIRGTTMFRIEGPAAACFNELKLRITATSDAKVKILGLNLFSSDIMQFR